MYVKVGGEIIDPSKTPIAVVFSEADKEAIKNMSEDDNIYLAYPNEMSKEEAERFINAIGGEEDVNTD